MKKTMLLAVLLMLGLAAGAFAQAPLPGAIFQGGTENVTLVVETGHTELTGDVYLIIMTGSNPSVAGTVTFKYNVPFTCPLAGDGAPVLTTSVGLAAAAIDANASDFLLGRLVITVPALADDGDWLRIHGVRLDVAGNPKPQYTVTLSSTGNAIFNGQFTAPVIDGSAAGLKSLATEAVELDALNDTQDGIATIEVKEGFNSAFGLGLVPDVEPLMAQMIKIHLSSAPPEGITLTFPQVVLSDGDAQWELASSKGVLLLEDKEVNFETASLDVYYILVSDNDPTMLETMTIPVDVVVDGADLPIPSEVITCTVTLAPVLPAFVDGDIEDADGNPLPIPRYEQALLGPENLVTVFGAQTALLAPLAQNMPAIGYDTGIAIANTTEDPDAADMGLQADAISQAGIIKFYMYQQQKGSAVPKLFTYTTDSTSPGTGLNASGKLAAGSTYTVLVSQLLEAAGITEEFQGYIIAVANFTNAHGLYVCSNFQTFSQGSSMVVLKGNRQEVPESLGQ
jgi:hypothetical protein